MSTAIEAMGLCLPGSSSNPAESPAKMRECANAAEAIKTCMEKNIRPRDLMTKESFENALVLTMALGGSTNGVLHFLAMAGTVSTRIFRIHGTEVFIHYFNLSIINEKRVLTPFDRLKYPSL